MAITKSKQWKEYLLCGDCEDLFQNYDKYGIETIRSTLLKKYRKTGVTFSRLDGYRLKFFILSIFWRAAVSKNTQYSKIKLPDYIAEGMREYCINKSWAPDRLISVTCKCLTGIDRNILENFTVTPYPVFEARDHDPRKRFAFKFILEGFMFDVLIPGFNYKSNKVAPGLIRKKEGIFFAPNRHISKEIELVELFGQAWVTGQKRNNSQR